jgi:hypothetical protein
MYSDVLFRAFELLDSSIPRLFSFSRLLVTTPEVAPESGQDALVSPLKFPLCSFQSAGGTTKNVAQDRPSRHRDKHQSTTTSSLCQAPAMSFFLGEAGG